ncbi:MAG: IS481 family transposase [Mariprofundaceae bacterium]
MAWKEVKPMDEKVLFISDYLRGGYNHSQLCMRYGISRKTGYKWIERYRSYSLAGLSEQSRRPHHSPEATAYPIRKAIIKLRKKSRMVFGSKKILALLRQQFPNDSLPSKSTIYNILKAEGLVEPRKRRQRVCRYPHALSEVQEANELWSVDYKGQFLMGDQQYCYPLTVMDHYSRYLLACDACAGTDCKCAKEHFIRLFQEYGLPDRIRSDNGVPFATKATGGLSSLSVWWIHLGISPERIEPGKPQQNGQHERMHRTLKKGAVVPASASFPSQQRRFDKFKYEYNHERPHESLDQTTPASHYQVSSREYPNKLPEIEYPDYFMVKPVSSNGVLYAHNGQVYVSNLLIGEQIGIEEIDDGVWDIYFGPVRLGGYNLRDVKGGKTPYWTIKV